MNPVSAIIAAFKYGSMVANPQTWKRAQVSVSAVVGLLSAAYVLADTMGWVPTGVTNEMVIAIGKNLAEVVFGVIAILAAANGAATVVSTEKIGVGPRPGMPEPRVPAELPESVSEPVPPGAVGASQPDIWNTGRPAESGRVAGRPADPRGPWSGDDG